jgi:hypothetical protein
MNQPTPTCRGVFSRIRLGFFGLLLLPLLAGCASYTSQTQDLRAVWRAGDYPVAAQIADTGSAKSSSTDAVLWDLEAGATTRAAGDTAGSLAAFQRADTLFDYWDTQPEISITRESASLLINPTVLPYRGTDYDRIMESTYQALNYLQLGKFDEARVELTRALERQRTALRNHADQLAKAQQATTQSASDGGYNAQAAQQDPRFQGQMSQVYGPLSAMHTYENYVNPFTTYLQGLCLLANPQSPSDLESARVDFERVRAMVGANPALDADADLATQMANNGAALPPTTWVVFETGTAPERQEVRIDIPLFIVSRDVPYVGIAFPRLVFNDFYDSGLTVQAVGGIPVNTFLVCNMDAVIGLDFRNELPSIIVKTLISAGAKAAALYGIEAATNNGGNLVNSLVRIAGTVYQFGANRADTRTWVTLPKQFQVCRLPTPADHKLYLGRAGTPESVRVDLPNGPVNMVYVKSSSLGSRLAISVFPLR